jgi:hypothetical protein
MQWSGDLRHCFKLYTCDMTTHCNLHPYLCRRCPLLLYYSPSALARKATAAAMSSGVPSRFSAVASI